MTQAKPFSWEEWISLRQAYRYASTYKTLCRTKLGKLIVRILFGLISELPKSVLTNLILFYTFVLNVSISCSIIVPDLREMDINKKEVHNVTFSIERHSHYQRSRRVCLCTNTYRTHSQRNSTILESKNTLLEVILQNK